MDNPANDTVSLRDHVDAQIKALDRVIAVRLDAMDEALRTSKVVLQDRFESVNEFRATLSDQSRSFVTSEQMRSEMARVEEIGRRNREDIDALRVRANLRDGAHVGSFESRVGLYRALGAAVAVLTIVIIFANFYPR